MVEDADHDARATAMTMGRRVARELRASARMDIPRGRAEVATGETSYNDDELSGITARRHARIAFACFG
jgi:hypothetical protein